MNQNFHKYLYKTLILNFIIYTRQGRFPKKPLSVIFFASQVPESSRGQCERVMCLVAKPAAQRASPSDVRADNDDDDGDADDDVRS